MLLYRPALVFGWLGDDSRIEGEQSGCGPHIALQGLGHQGFDQRALLTDVSRLTSLTDRYVLAELGGQIARQI